jgi:hypothetical protein
MEVHVHMRHSDRMDDAVRPPLHDRLRLVESLLRAVEDSMSPLQRLVSEVHKEIGLALHEEMKSGREEELSALRREVDQLREGMVSRAAIERAKGMLMQGHGLTESQSFDLLGEMSQRYRRKLRDVAADIVSGSLPVRLTGVPPAGARPGRPVPETPSRARSTGPATPEPAGARVVDSRSPLH